MYTIKVDGQEVYSPALSDDPVQILSPRLQLEVNTAGALSFIVPPGHAVYHTIAKLKSIVTMEWDGVEIFRGRVLEEKVDFYNQKEVYCEGALAFLLDSVQRPFSFSGTAKEYCTQAIATHNSQVEKEKQFTIGDFSALTDETKLELESDGYSDTLSAIQAVLEEHEGFLHTRYVDGVNYLDYVTSAGTNDGQAIEFGVNLIDLDNHTAAEEICTVMLPIGGMLEDGTTVTIASVNNDSDTIEDPEGILRYGRIVKTYVFDDETDPSKLKSKAQAKMDEMALARTLTLNAVDMHLIDSKQGIILPGVPVLIRAFPQGLDIEEMCTAVDLDPENPEKTVYTFGEPAKTQSGTSALIANQIRTHTNTIQKLYKHYKETDYTVKIHAGLLDSHDEYISQAFIQLDGINAKIDLKADKTEVTELGKRLSSAEIAIDGAEAAIALKADQTLVAEQGKRISDAEVAIDGANAAIALKASQEDVTKLEGDMEGLTTRLSQAEIDIDGANAAIALKADQSTVEQLEGDLEGVTNRLSDAEVAIDGANAAIALKAEQSYVKDLDNRLGNIGDRVSAAEIAIDGANAAINLKASQTTVDALGERVSAAEIAIDGANSRIDLKADLIALEGYVTVEELEATNASISNLTSGLTVASVLSANLVQGTQADITYLSAASFNLAHNLVSIYDISMGDVVASKVLGTDGSIDLAHSHAVTVNDDGTITLGEVSSTGGSFKIADTAYYKNGVSAAKESVTLSAPNGWQNGRYVVEASNGKTLAVDLPDFTVSGGDSFNASHKTTVYFSTGSVTGPLSSKEVDASGVYSSGLSAGASTVTLSSAGWVNGTYVVEATNGETLTVNLPAFTVSGGNYFDTAHKTTVYFFTDGVTGSLAKKEVDATSVYNTGVSAGASSVSLSSAGWVNGSYVVNASNGKKMTVSLPEFTVSGGEVFNTSHKTTVYFFTDGVTGSLANKEVDATVVYNTGRNSVSLSSAGWVNGSYVVNASNGKSMTVSLPAFTVSGGEIFNKSHLTTVYFFTDGVTGSLAKKEVDATPVYNTGWNECISEAKSMGSWSNMCTISENSPGTLYMLVNGVYTSVGSSWVKVNAVSGTFYKLPATK